jgi:hypothetical protein
MYPTILKLSLGSDRYEIIMTIGGFNLFKFTDDLQNRLEISIDSLPETLRERQKANMLTPEEITELAGITELVRVASLWRIGFLL